MLRDGARGRPGAPVLRRVRGGGLDENSWRTEARAPREGEPDHKAAMKKIFLALPVLVGVALLTSACAKEPADAVAAARSALTAARAAQAADYAPASLSAAESAVAALDAELKAQSERFALTRSYTKATELATAAKAAGDTAVADAATGKAAAQAEATTLIAAVRTGVDEVKLLLDKAPKGKGSQADIEALKSDLAGIEASLADMDAAMASGAFKDAKAKGEAAQQGLDRIRTDIQAAIAAKAGARR